MSSCSQKPFYTIVPLKLDFAAEKGGMAVSALWRLVYFLAPYPSEPKEQTAAHRRDALCPSTKIQKQAAFGIMHRLSRTADRKTHRSASSTATSENGSLTRKRIFRQDGRFEAQLQ